jgi:hypothetical protein
MKKIIVAVIAAFLLVNLAAVAYKMGWLAVLGVGPSPSTSTGAGQAAPAQGGSTSAAGTGAIEELDVRGQELAAAMAGVKQGTQPSPAEAADKLASALAALEAVDREVLQPSLDPESVAKTVGSDPQALSRWVAERTLWVPYRGRLRGAAGMLMDRRGNSLDRAELLAALLSAAGHSVRLARGTLTEQQARTLWPALTSARTLGSMDGQATAAAVQRAVDGYVAQQGADREQVAALTRTLDSGSLAAANALKADARTRSAALAKAVDLRGSTSIEPTAADLAALSDHWWVQVRQGEAWVDVDVLAAAGSQAVPLTKVEKTFAAGGIPPGQQHRVRLRVVIEQEQAGRRKPKVVLDHVFAPSETWGQRLVLRHVPLKWPNGLRPASEADARARADKFAAAVAAQDAWRPVLVVGDHLVNGEVFTESGRPYDAGSARGGPAAPSGMGGLFGGLSGSETADNGQGILTAEWIEYEILVPGEPAQIIRRPVFDLVGPARRASNQPAPAFGDAERLDCGWALLGDVETLALAARPSQEAVAHLVATGFIQAGPRLVEHLRASNRAGLRDEAARLLTRTSPAFELALGRSEWSPDPDAVYLDRPNIIGYRARLERDAAGTLALIESLDLAFNEVAVVPGARANAPTIRLAQGVADTAAERAVLSGFGRIENAIDVFDAATAASVRQVVLRTAGDIDQALTGQAGDVRARLDEDVRAGYVVVIPAQPVPVNGRPRAAWWKIRPTSGDAVGVLESGLHGAAARWPSLAMTMALVPAAPQPATERSIIEARLTALFDGGWDVTIEEVAQADAHVLARRLGLKYAGKAALAIQKLQAECCYALLIGL